MEFSYFGMDEFLRVSLKEDIGTGDITTNCCVPAKTVSSGVLVAKEPGVICGTTVLKRVFALLDDTIIIKNCVPDGSKVVSGDIIAEINGNARNILSGERTALNLLQRLSGIATKTALAVASVAGTKAVIVDTRKTTPGLRVLEKYAVKCGGGSNHRFNLADGVLIKDNHIAAAGGITQAVELARKNCPQTLKIEVEAETLEQVTEAADAGADIIMLDNMTPEIMTKAVGIINGRALTEASGNMGERDLKIIAETGVDFISIGGLTHSVKALDISLKFK